VKKQITKFDLTKEDFGFVNAWFLTQNKNVSQNTCWVC
jgi:hypothetical protein